MPTVMHERGAAAQYPGGMEGISNAKNLGIKASDKHFAYFCFLSSDEESHALTKHKSMRHYSVTYIRHYSEHREGLELNLAPRMPFHRPQQRTLKS